MANRYGTNATNITNVPADKAGTGEIGGRVRWIYDELNYTALLANADVIYLGGLIPKGARVLDAILMFSDAGTTGSCNVGWLASADGVEVADADGFMAAVNMNTAADTIKASDNLANAPGIFKKFAAPVQPVVTMTAAGDAATGSVKLAICYIID